MGNKGGWLRKFLSLTLLGCFTLPGAAQVRTVTPPAPVPNPNPAPSPSVNPSSTYNGDLRSYIIANRYRSYFNGISGSRSPTNSLTGSPYITQMQQGMLPGGMMVDPWQTSNPYLTPFMNPAMLFNNAYSNPMMSNPFMNPMVSNPMMSNPFMNPMMVNPFQAYNNPFMMQPGLFGQMNNPFMQGGGMFNQPGMFGRGF